MAGRVGPRQSGFRLLFEAELDGARFFQVAVVRADTPWEAHARVQASLAREGAELVWVDPEETVQLELVELPARLQADAAHGVVEVSERMRVVAGAPGVPGADLRPARAAVH